MKADKLVYWDQENISYKHTHLDRIFLSAEAAALDVMPMGVAVLDQNGRILSANRMALGILEAGEGIYADSDGVVIERKGKKRRLHELAEEIRQSEQSSQDQIITMRAERDAAAKRPVTALLAPVVVNGADEKASMTLLFLGDPDFKWSFSANRIAQLYGLTRAEARIAALLASGYRLEQTAELLGVAYETARKHLKNIFGKTECDRQVELVRMLVTGPAALSL